MYKVNVTSPAQLPLVSDCRNSGAPLPKLIHIRGPPTPYPQKVDNLPFFFNLSLSVICFWKALEQTRPSMAMVDLPDTMIDLPDTMVHLPDSMVHLPDYMVYLFDSMADLPDTMVDLPHAMVDLPDTMVDFPYTMVDLPRHHGRPF